ncbi:hypothetical protein [Acinetobacter towneri]|uniref:hypothetical protein n=1 Tax=Acinetobacter towneri TaxID=202956 RepID=UPI003212D1CE
MTTLAKKLFVQRQAELNPHQHISKHAIDLFGENSAVAKLMVQKDFTSPSQEDYAAIAASQQFVNLIKEKSLIGQIEAIGKHLAMPLNKPLSSFDLSACEVVTQAQPTAILSETSEIGFTLDFKKIGGYAIFPDRYLSREYYAQVEPLINTALQNSYIAGENADFIDMLTTDATVTIATGSTMPSLLADITNALASIDDPQDAAILINPFTALEIANTLELDSLGVNGGSLRGITVITNKSVPQNQKIVFDLTKLVLAADPSVEIKLTNEANVYDSTGTTVALFQQNKIAVKIMGVNGYAFKTGYTATIIETEVGA